MKIKSFDRYGGYATVRRIVLALYDRLVVDDEVGSFFNAADMPNLVDHQTLFVSSLMGGPASFSDEYIRDAHRALEITHAHFDRLKAIVEATLLDFGLERTDVDTVLAEFEARRPLLVRRTSVT